MSKKELKIDENHISKQAMEFQDVIDRLSELKMSALNAEQDVFVRYMAYIKMRHIMLFLNFAGKSLPLILSDGHALSHSSLRSDKANEYNWTMDSVKDNSFFIQEDLVDHEDAISDKRMREIIGKFLNRMAI